MWSKIILKVIYLLPRTVLCQLCQKIAIKTRNRNSKSKLEIEIKPRNPNLKSKLEIEIKTRNRNSKSKLEIESQNHNSKSKLDFF